MPITLIFLDSGVVVYESRKIEYLESIENDCLFLCGFCALYMLLALSG